MTNSFATAGGLFGPPQTVSREAGGLSTAIGYRYYEDTFRNDRDYVIRQNQIYSQVAYGASNIWEIYGRVGISDLKVFDAFTSTDVLTTTSKDHFEENWKFFGTLGAKGFYPFNHLFGMGAFLQASYNFSNFTDEVAGIRNAAPFLADLKIKNLWDVNVGVSLQATLPPGIRLYAGPFIYYAEAAGDLSDTVSGISSGPHNFSWKNKSAAGGFVGADVPLAKGFRLNIEGQYTDRFSIGSAITYTY